MAKNQAEDKLFSNEAKILHHYRDLLDTHEGDKIDRAVLEDLVKKYGTLLEQSKFLTWISGRLERKLQKVNQELFVKNHDMQNALNDLIKAKAGKSAYTIIYFIAIVLFVLEEFFVEPVITAFGGGLSYSILIKLVIVLLLKSSEGFIEEQLILKSPLKKIIRRKTKTSDQAT
jgi:hypothetical protein